MAHFGVKKAKLLALAGAIAITGAGIMSAGNASAIEDFSTLSRGTDYDCGTEDSYYTITMHTTKAVKWAVK
ncbi:MAG: hypothetical protein Q4F56_03400, partial [Candidatus Saccharibacteria bacterium]|nr:hypothetical protein [Candidatus Saccharibacteria bacterium]